MFLDSSEELFFIPSKFFFIPSISCEEFFFNGGKLGKKLSDRGPTCRVCTVLLSPKNNYGPCRWNPPPTSTKLMRQRLAAIPLGRNPTIPIVQHPAHIHCPDLYRVFSDPPRWPPQVVRSRCLLCLPLRATHVVSHTCATLNTNGKL
jgi:hypothetical protein